MVVGIDAHAMKADSLDQIHFESIRIAFNAQITRTHRAHVIIDLRQPEIEPYFNALIKSLGEKQ